MTEATATARGSTGSSDYSATYYLGGHLGPPYTYEEPHWRVFFGGVADALVATFQPTSVYDAGCAIGLFVRALLDRGVDAYGGDISEFAVQGAPPGLRERLEVRDLTRPFDRRYDLISCIEVLEHMSTADAQIAIANICAATDTVLLSSTPEDFNEPTHINVRTPASWAQDFARHGFFRRTDVDASFLSPWAVVFSRRRPTVVELVNHYETLVAPLSREVVAKRQALLEVQRELDRLRAQVAEQDAGLQADVRQLRVEKERWQSVQNELIADRDRLQDELVRLRSGGTPDEQLVRLAMVDELIGLRAEVVQARIRADNAVADARKENEELVQQLKVSRDELDEIRETVTWRIGRASLLPVRMARRLRRR
jgi:SAM-dependent methyltransferase